MKTSETCTFAICLDDFFVSNFIFVHISTVCYLNILSPVFFNGLDDTVNSYKHRNLVAVLGSLSFYLISDLLFIFKFPRKPPRFYKSSLM